MLNVETVQKSAGRVQPLVDILTRDLDDKTADEVQWELKNVALNMQRGVKCAQEAVRLCGRCEWISEETGLNMGVCTWILENEQPSLKNVLIEQPPQRIYFVHETC